MPAVIPDWKTARDAMVKSLRDSLTKDTTPEVMTLMAKFEVKLKKLSSEQEFTVFNTLCEKTVQELSAKYDNIIRIEMLKKLTAE